MGVVARWHGLDEQIQAGEFALNAPLTAGEFIAKLAAGEVVRRSVTLPEGITLAAASVIPSGSVTLRRTTSPAANFAMNSPAVNGAFSANSPAWICSSKPCHRATTPTQLLLVNH